MNLEVDCMPENVANNTKRRMNDFLKFFLDNEDAIAVLTSAITAIATIVGAVVIPVLLVRITGEVNRKNTLAMQINDEKRKLFQAFVDMLFDMMDTRKQGSEEKLREKMLEFKKQLLLVASEKTLREFNRWQLHTDDQVAGSNHTGKKNTIKNLARMDRFLSFLRNDIGLADRDYSEPFYVKLLTVLRIRKRHYPRVQLMVGEKLK